MDWLKAYSKYLYPVCCLLLAVYLITLAYAADVSPSPQTSPIEKEDGVVAPADETSSPPARNDGAEEAAPDNEKELAPKERVEEVAPGEETEPIEVKEEIQIPDVVATVNGANIIRDDLERRMAQSRAMDPERFDAIGIEQRKRAIKRVIDNMVLREVIYQEAVKRNIVVADSEIDLNLENLRRQFLSEEAFKKAFSDANITIPSWKSETRKSLMAMKLEDLMVDEVPISDKEIEDYYEKNKKELNRDAVKTSHILVKTEADAKKVITEFKKNKDFAGLAKKYSQDTFTKEKGGELGWLGKEDLLSEIEDTVYSLSTGQISGPVKTQFGYHIILLHEKKLASDQTIEDHREHIMSILQQNNWQKLRSAWEDGLLALAEVWKWSP